MTPVNCCRYLVSASCLFLLSLTGSAFGNEPVQDDSNDAFTTSPGSIELVSEDLKPTVVRSRVSGRSLALRTPAMIGDFYAGNPLSMSANTTQDRLFVFASDLDAPFVLPGANSPLSISEPGPVGIYSSTLMNVQQIQSLLRSSSPLPPASLVGTVADNASMTTNLSVGQIQALIGSTGAGYDIISLNSPAASYGSAVEAVFLTRNTIPGSTVFNSSASGALLQGGVDTLNGGEDFDAFYFYDYVVRFNTVLADATSGGVGRMKMSEGGTVLPQDRVFFRYSHLSGVGYGDSRANLNRFVPGFERAFLDGLCSLEIRAPFATDARTASSMDGNVISNGEHTRFGNFSIYLKTLLIERERFALSGGLGVALPSAEDITVNYANGTPLLRVANESVRLQPFLGSLYYPSERCFVQSFFQVDTAANGNTVLINSSGTGLTEVGRLTDSTNLFVDVGIGYWLYRNNSRRGLTGIVPMLELHHNNALQGSDLLGAGPFQVSNSLGNTSLTNIVVGNTLEFGQRTNLTAAYTGPLGGGLDRQYNGGLQLFLSHGW